jgi:hypothetical protein
VILDTEKGHFEIWLKALTLTGGYVFCIYLAHRLLMLRISSRPLGWIISFGAAQAVIILFMLLRVLFLKARQGIRNRRAERIQALIRERMASHAAGLNRIEQLVEMRRKYPRETELCMMELIATVSAEGRDRLSHLAVTLGMVSIWRKQCRSRDLKKHRQAIARLAQLSGGVPDAALLSSLVDADCAIRLEASRGLTRTGGKRELEKVFSFALTQVLFVRAILARDFLPHSLVLCESAVPEAVASADSNKILAALEIVQSWKTVVPVPGFSRLLRHSDPEVRGAAFRVLPFVTNAGNVEDEVLDALHHADPRVRTSAAFAAGRLGLQSAVPLLAACLHASDATVTLAAAHALARIDPAGTLVLENEVLLSQGPSAAVSLEALEKSRITQSAEQAPSS